MNYEIKKGGKGFSIIGDTIYMQLTKGNLTDDEIIEYISDSLTHEHIHNAIEKLFDFDTSQLLDVIQHLFRNESLVRRHFAYINNESFNNGVFELTWLEYKEIYGFEQLLNRLRISIDTFNRIKILTSIRSG